jgi:DNA polymerase-3 subunit delta
MKALIEDIKAGHIKQIYLLYGEEAYLRRQYRDKLKQILVRDGDTMNYHYYEGKKAAIPEIIDLAETLPFFADRRLIIWENSGLFKTADEKLTEYLKAMPETTGIIFVEAEVDKRGRMFKLIQGMGGAAEFAGQDEETLKRWIAGILKKENKRISERAAVYLLGKTGMDMDNIKGELEKLICYCLDRDTVTEEDIDAVCTVRITNHIFDMVGAIADKKQDKALRLYYDLLTLKEPPMRILFLIARQFNVLLQVKELKKKGYDHKTIGTKVGLPGFIAGKYAAQAAGFEAADLREALEACVEADEAVKTGRMNDVMSVELLIIQYSGSPSQGVSENSFLPSAGRN